jgi:hypothetical protein
MVLRSYRRVALGSVLKSSATEELARSLGWAAGLLLRWIGSRARGSLINSRLVSFGRFVNDSRLSVSALGGQPAFDVLWIREKRCG